MPAIRGYIHLCRGNTRQRKIRQDNGIDESSLKLFKMRQDDDCVNDKDHSCSEDNSNLRPKD